MAKSKEGRPSEHYLAEIRKLRSENRNLKKRLKRLERKEHIFDEQDEEDTELQELPIGEAQQTLGCVECGKGQITTFEIMGKVYGTCSVCGDRKRLK